MTTSSSTRAERPIPKSALTHLDLLRGAAAMLVLVGHVRGLFFTDWEAVVRRTLGLKLFYLASGLGHECVIVFFVLSGFFIGHSVLVAHRAGKWDWGHYAVRRLSRLYVVLLPGLILTALLDLSGMHFFGSDHGIYAGDIGARHLQLADARKTTGIGNFIANLLFLQNLRTPEYGTNGPLWSLSYEFWYYVLFPMGVRAFAGSARTVVRVLLGVAFVGLLALGGKAAAVYFAIWCMGALVAFLWQMSPGLVGWTPRGSSKEARSRWSRSARSSRRSSSRASVSFRPRS